MEQKCGNCAHLNTHDKKEAGSWFSGYHDEYYCQDLKKYVGMDEGKNCNYWRECPHNQNNNGGGCFITTIVVSMCGFDDKKSRALNILRNFRNRVLQNTVEGTSALKIYDVVGPQIAARLSEQAGNKQLGYKIYSEDLLPVIGALEKNQYYEAMTLYKAMVERLAYQYGISMDVDGFEYDSSVTPEQMGHGTARLHKQSVNNQ